MSSAHLFQTVYNTVESIRIQSILSQYDHSSSVMNVGSHCQTGWHKTDNYGTKIVWCNDITSYGMFIGSFTNITQSLLFSSMFRTHRIPLDPGTLGIVNNIFYQSVINWGSDSVNIHQIVVNCPYSKFVRLITSEL